MTQDPPNYDAVIDRLMAEGATDDEITDILKEMKSQTAPPATSRRASASLLMGAPVIPTAQPMQQIAGDALGNFGDAVSSIGRGVLSGAKASLDRTAGLVASAPGMLPVTAALNKLTGKDATKLRESKPAEVDPNSKMGGIEKASQFVGQMAGSLPLFGSINAATVNAGARLATRVSDPTLKAFLTRSVPGSFWKSAAASAPANVVEGVISDAAMYPEEMRTPENILRSAALSLGGTIFDGFAGSKVIGQAIEDATSPAEIKRVVSALEEARARGPEGPTSPLPEGQYSRWIPDASVVSAKRVDDLLNGPMPTAAEVAAKRNTRLFEQLADEKLLKLGNEAAAQAATREGLAASPGKTGLFTPGGKLKSIVSVEPTADDRIAAASLQNAIDKAAESLKTIAGVRKGSGRAIDNLSFIEADVSNSLLTFEELDELGKSLSMFYKRGEKGLNKQQKFVADVQDRLAAAAKKGFANMNMKEILDLEDNLLAMSRRLDEQGFDAPAKKFIGDVPDKNAPPHGTVKITEPAPPKLDPPQRFDTDERLLSTGGRTAQQIDDDSFVRGFAPAPDQPPKVSITSAQHFKETIEQSSDEIADILREANIEYEKPKPIGPQPTIRQNLQDRNIPIRALHEQSYDMLNNLGAARRAADNAVARRGGLLLPKLNEQGIWDGKTMDALDAMPLLEIQRTAGKRVFELEALLKAYRTVADETVDTGMSVEAAKKTIAALGQDPLLSSLAKEYKKNTDFMVDYMVALKRLAPEQGDKFKAMMYAPLGRVFNKPRNANFLSFRKGSARKSEPIFEQTVEMMYATIERTQRNYAWNQLIEQWKIDPIKMNDHIQLAGSVNPAMFEDQIKELVAAGVPQKDAADWIKAMHSGVYDKSDGSLIVFNNGIASKYYVSDALATAIKSNSPMELNNAQKVLMAISTPMRESVALGLDLSLLGPLSDAVSASAQDPGFRFFVDPIRGAWNAALRTDTYKKAVAAGMGFGGRLRPDDNIIRPGSGVLSNIKTFRSPISALNDMLRPLSEASRMGLYLSQIRQGATPQKAATFSNNALGNWNVIGAKMRAWVLMTEFGNVGIQSGMLIPKTIKRAIKDPKVAASVAIVGTGAITMPTLYLLSAYADDDELNAMRRADNYDYWYWRDEAGEPQRMRKPGWWLVPIFGSSVEAAWDGMDSAARKRLSKSFLNSIMFNPVPISLQTGLGLLNNDTSPLNPVSDIPIVPGGQQDVDPAIQGTLQNSKLAMGVRDAVGVSPFKTDFFLRQTLGSDIFSLLAIASGGTVGSKDRLPVLGRYSVSPRTPTEGSMMFYEDLKRAREVDKTVKEYALKGDEAGMNKYIEKNKKWAGLYNSIVGPSQQLAQYNVLLRQISADPIMTKETKRKYEELYRSQMNDFFREYATVRKEMLKEQ